MILRLLHIDFDAGDAALTVYPDAGEANHNPLPDLLRTLESYGIETVTFYGEGDTLDEVRMNIAVTASDDLDIVVTGDAYVPNQPDHLVNAVWSNQRSGEFFVARTSPVVYAMRFTELDSALNRITAVIVILGSTGSTCGSCNHLRFACYELAANTIEHARFTVPAPEIRVGIRPLESGIHLSYRDNAQHFDTRSLANIDVGGKIARGERRGLGLFMLNRIAGSFDYERTDGWNITTMSIPDAASGAELRRNSMSEINIKITPCDADRTVVLRPVGTVDSATSGVLESQISELLKQDVQRIVVDMIDVEFISSSGIGVFLGSVSGLRSRGGDLLFMNVPTHVEDVFDIVNLKSYFRTITSLDELQPTR